MNFTLPTKVHTVKAMVSQYSCLVVKVKWSEVVQSCLALCHPVDCSPPGSSVHGILQARILEWVSISFSRGFPDPGMEPRSPALQADALTSEPPGTPWLWELDHKEGWVPENWFFQTVILEKISVSPLDCKEIQQVNPDFPKNINLECSLKILMLKLKLQYFGHLK